MSNYARIYAVTVNHNTSHFIELMVRTLLLTNDRSSLDLTLTILDNGSNDEQCGALTSYLAGQHITFAQTGFDTSVAVEKHGVALERFIRGNSDCTHYLFLDADMWFFESHTISTMLDELTVAGPGVFANQARIAGYYAGRIIEGRDGIPGAKPFDEQASGSIVFDNRQYLSITAPRCSPVCSLVTNTPLFRQVVETVGLSPAIRFGVGQVTYYDTFSLMTHVMTTHSQRFVVSSKTINHFTQASYAPEYRAPKDHDCLLMLQDLRTGRGMVREIFWESEWVKQQRQQLVPPDVHM
jgi:hypothetical protein